MLQEYKTSDRKENPVKSHRLINPHPQSEKNVILSFRSHVAVWNPNSLPAYLLYSDASLPAWVLIIPSKHARGLSAFTSYYFFIFFSSGSHIWKKKKKECLPEMIRLQDGKIDCILFFSACGFCWSNQNLPNNTEERNGLWLIPSCICDSQIA